jgi:CDP-diacylglycerol--glycerol-3-phosphate 3-phosphatidyltransferase
MFGQRTVRAQLPNVLTALRLVMAAAFIALGSFYDYAAGEQWMLTAALALFVVAALTDFFDGYLARRWNAISIFGRVMDPLADKLLVLSAFILLAGPTFAATVGAGDDARTTQLTGVWPWMAAVILSRELLVTSLRGVCEARGIDFSASMTGKLKMVAQSAGVPIILLLVVIADGAAPGSGSPATLALVNMWIGGAIVLITVWSALPYLTRAYRGLAEYEKRVPTSSSERRGDPSP